MFKMIYNIARTELQMLFYSPVAWLLLVVFTVQSALLFNGVLERMLPSIEMGYSVTAITYGLFVDPFGGVFPNIQGYLYFYIPLLTMSVISLELSSGSIKLLYSSPVTNIQIIIGKYFAMMLYGAFMMSVLVLLILNGGCIVEHFDWSMAFTGLLGVYLLLCAYAAIGIFMSSLTSYQIVAAIGTLIVLMLLNMVGGWGQDIDFIRNITYWLSINGRSMTFINGMICSEDLIYFIVVICLFLSLTIIRLNAVRQKIKFSITLGRNLVVIVVACLIGYLSSMPRLKAYYDATETKMNTLTPNSQNIVKQMTGDVTITTYINVLDPNGVWFATGGFLLPDMERFEQYLRFKPDMKLKYVYYYDTCANPQLDVHYPGMSLREKMVELCKIYGYDTSKFLTPTEIRAKIDLLCEGNTFVRQIERENGEKTWLRIYNDMERFPSEREISAAFKRMVMKLPVVGFLQGHGERNYDRERDRDYSSFANDKKFRYALMNQGFDVEYVTLDKPIREDINIMIIAENREPFTETEDAILQQYIDRGGNLFILGEPKRQEVMNPLFAKFGFELMKGQLVKQDTNLQADIIVSWPTLEAEAIAYDFGTMRRQGYVIASQGVVGLRQVVDLGYKVTELFKSDTVGSWNELETIDFVDDTIRLNPAIGEVEQSYPTMVALSRQINGKEQRVILSGDADCISNGELMGRRRGINASNFSIIMGSFFWLSDNEVPIDVRRPAFPDDSLYIGSMGVSVMWWMFVVILPVILLAVAIVLNVRRKSH
ncbi:MAG: Gldg family protein [Marinifilaceae bacterium]|nr:Gldg family protein [Marinifilaceae bacterium]